MATTDLGAVTSYADAVAGGYTGTLAEWRALLANLDSDAQTASAKAAEATSAAAAAEESLADIRQKHSEVTTMHDEVMQQEAANKQDKDTTATVDDMAVFDENGNTVDSGIHKDDVVVHPGVYDDLNVGLAKNLQDPMAPSTARKFGLDTACGDVSISDNGIANPTLVRGTTYIQNQLVGDTKVVKDQGYGVVRNTHSVAGDIPHAVVKGKSYIKNQIIPASVEKTATADGNRLEITDGTAAAARSLTLKASDSVVYNQLAGASGSRTEGGTSYVKAGTVVSGNAEALRMTAPRSVVVNQLVSEYNFLSATVITSSTRDANHSFVIEYNNTTDATAYATFAMPAQGVHTLLCKSTILASTGDLPTRLYINASSQNNFLDTSAVVNLTRADAALYMSMASGTSGTLTLSVQVVDLTQYFNGNTTLINSITSWADLVAYDPRFASYVAYNTGTVEGVTPTLKITGKNLLPYNTAQTFLDASTLAPDGFYRRIVVSGLNPSQKYTASLFTTFIDSSSDTRMYLKGRDMSSDAPWVRIFRGEVGVKHVTGYPDSQGNLYVDINKTVWTSHADDISNIQLELGDIATDYEAYYNGASITSPDELFAIGDVADVRDAVSGVTTRKVGKVDLGTLTWHYESSYQRFYTDIIDDMKAPATSWSINAVCDKYEGTSSGIGHDPTTHNKQYSIYETKRIYLRDTAYSDVSTFTTAMSGVWFYYELATPTSATFIPATVALQAGNAVVTQTDGGRPVDLELQYQSTLYPKVLLSNHTYLKYDGTDSSKFTGESSVQLDGTTDKLVDLTQYYGGVAAKVSAISTWADLVAADADYSGDPAYNEGVVKGVAATVRVTGKNLFDQSVFLRDIAGCTLSNGYYTGDTSKFYAYTTGTKSLLPASMFKPNTQYAVSYTGYSNNASGWNIKIHHTDGTIVQAGLTTTTATTYKIVSTANKTVSQITFGWSNGSITYIKNLQIEQATAATAYAAYVGTEVQSPELFSVDGTSDTFDAVTGTTTHAIGNMTLDGTENWAAYSSTSYAGFSVNMSSAIPSNVTRLGYLSDKGLVRSVPVGGTSGAGIHIWVGVGNRYVYLVWDKGYTIPDEVSNWYDASTDTLDVSAFKTWLTNNNVHVKFILPTPTTTSGTPTAVTLAKGYGQAVQADTGRPLSDIALGYDGTAFEQQFNASHTYACKIGGSSVMVTDGMARAVTGGVDMAVDLTVMFNGASAPIAAITDWGTLVSTTGLYGSYTAYDEGTVVHSDQTAVMVCGKNLFDKTDSGISNGWQGDNGIFQGTNGYRTTNYIPVLPFSQITASYPSGGGSNPAICFYTADKHFISGIKHLDNSLFSITYTVPANCHYVKDSFKSSDLDTYQLELGATATPYVPYYDGGSASAGLLRGIPGSHCDEVDLVTGRKVTRIGSYTFTGNETWNTYTAQSNTFIFSGITNAYRIANNTSLTPTYMMEGYDAAIRVDLAGAPDQCFNLNCAQHTANQLVIKDTSCSTTTEIAAKMAGKTVYYRLKDSAFIYTDGTAAQLTQPDGESNVIQTAGTLAADLNVSHEVTEWDEPLIRNCKYLYRDAEGAETILTGSTMVVKQHVIGGSEKLVNLTHWYGKGKEPTVEAFYREFPTWRHADLPEVPASPLSYKGTGVRTVGFNCYNHATGTARLLGGNEYQICGDYTGVSYADQWGRTEELEIDADGIFTPANTGILTVAGGNGTNTCVHLTWSGYKNYGKPGYKWELYAEHGVVWDLSWLFPNGMQGIRGYHDEVTSDGLTRNFAIVDAGDLTWGKETTSYAFTVFYATLSDKLMNTNALFFTAYPQLEAGGANYLSDVSCNSLGSNGRLVCVRDDSKVMMTVEEFKASVAGQKIIYLTDTPITEAITPAMNLSYTVNDFGTEESLPANTTILNTTDLNADIQYSIDFTRTVQHYSEIESDVEQLAEEKDNLARADGNYGDKGGVFTYATQLMDPNAPPTLRQFSNDTAAGDISIADNSTGVVTSIQGTTQVQNQLVKDSNMNTKSSTDGKLVLTDAVGGEVTKMLVKGGCVVHNQLVRDYVEKTVTGTKRLGCSDGVAGPAKSLVIKAPRSVVMNQKVQKINTTNWQFGSHATGTFGDGTVDFLCDAQYGSVRTRASIAFQAGHQYIYHLKAKCANGTHPLRIYGGAYWAGSTVALDTTLRTYSGKGIGSGVATEGQSVLILQDNTASDFSTITVQDVMFVDLTVYFNGNTTLINSINTWDDLVAYDSTFASYVPYNTGTVQGVQPTVRFNHATNVACPVELFGVVHATNSTKTSDDEFDGVSGLLTKRVGSVDLGTLTWRRGNNQGNWENTVFFAQITDMKSNTYSVICSIVTYGDTLHYAGSADDRVYISSNYIYIKKDTITDVESFVNYVNGVPFYYELEEPTTSQYTSTALSVLNIYNNALQTAGSRACELSLTYDGRNQTIPLNPNHTYVFNDNQASDSLITGQSSIDAVGGEDQLVDITQFYNGDATKIADIHRWASLSTRFHRYRYPLPYNPGTVEPYCPTIRVFPNEYAYGAIYDPNQTPTTCQRVMLKSGVISEVASFAAFDSHPCHELYKCIMPDLSNRTIAYYLDDADSDRKYNGTRNDVASDGGASVLTGADGDVMSEFPVGYWDVDEDYLGTGKILYLISDRPFMGSWYPAEIHDFFYVSPDGSTPRKQYVGSHRGTLCDANGVPLNTTEGAAEQNTGDASTVRLRSVAGAIPVCSTNITNMTTYSARNGGSLVNTKYHQWLQLLMMIENGDTDSQKYLKCYSEGLGNAFHFLRKTGRLNVGNGTGSLSATPGSQDLDNFQCFTLNNTKVYRDTLADADGRYAWSAGRTVSYTRFYTNSATPANGDLVYSASTGTATIGTVASWTNNADKTIQCVYRGIENPFGEQWEFEQGIQAYNYAALMSITCNGVTYTRDPAMDGVNSRAYVDGDNHYIWTALSITSGTSHGFLDEDLTQDSGYTVASSLYAKCDRGYWETLATDDYTVTNQQTATTPVYTWRQHSWPDGTGYISRFDPLTFLARSVSGGGLGKYMPEQYATASNGERIPVIGGAANHGANAGIGSRSLSYAPAATNVAITGRTSA